MVAVAGKLNSQLPLKVVKFISVFVCVCVRAHTPSPKVYNIFDGKD